MPSNPVPYVTAPTSQYNTNHHQFRGLSNVGPVFTGPTTGEPDDVIATWNRIIRPRDLLNRIGAAIFDDDIPKNLEQWGPEIDRLIDSGELCNVVARAAKSPSRDFGAASAFEEVADRLRVDIATTDDGIIDGSFRTEGSPHDDDINRVIRIWNDLF